VLAKTQTLFMSSTQLLENPQVLGYSSVHLKSRWFWSWR